MNKATASVVSAIKEVYGIDISERVIIGNKHNFFTFDTDGMDENYFNNVQRFTNGKGKGLLRKYDLTLIGNNFKFKGAK